MLTIAGGLALLIGGYAWILSCWPNRLSSAAVLLTVGVIVYLWTMPRLYALAGGNQSIVVNQEGTGRNWTLERPFSYFGETENVGRFFGSMLIIGVVMGGVVAYKVRQVRAARSS